MKKTVLAINPATPYNDIINEIKNNLEVVHPFDDYNNLHIIQLGAGGTGGYVAYEILRMLGNLPEEIKPHIHYTLMDGDTYEPKNLGRQLCCEDDMGRNKAEVLIEDYGELFGVGRDLATHINEYFTDVAQLAVLPKFPLPVWSIFVDEDCNNKLFKDNEAAIAFNSKSPQINQPATSFIIIDCVDKNAPRKLLHDYFADIDSLPNSLARVNYSLSSEAGEYEHVSVVGQDLAVHTQNGESLLGCTYGITPVRDIYIISSGNGKYTGQVSWGRKSFLGNSTGPMHYKDIFGDRDVSSIMGPKIDNSLEPVILQPEMTVADFNQIRLKNLASYYFTQESIQQLTNGNFQEISDPTTGQLSNGYIKSIPVPMDSSTSRQLNTAHPILRNLNMFMSAFMSTPTPYDRFPELTDLEADAREEAMSCAERAEHNVQSINANKTAAALVINYFTSIFNGMYPLEKEIPVLTTETTRFNILTGEYSSDPITTESLQISVATRNRVRVN